MNLIFLDSYIRVQRVLTFSMNPENSNMADFVTSRDRLFRMANISCEPPPSKLHIMRHLYLLRTY